ncbi:MAG: pyridoxal-phosphate dependent enzyme [Acidobacteria bacterium]|nr:pyridoxal-phosphate dependent enzyme [Acidobacteriota bacterium]MYA45573.1 pyridoxal-phosphate dependent enzyme [Acidobacteriota bacterium]MYI37534.1 pyridoxal-phosphate dependent enzyme [Acidobacteriota bacterium]
MTTSDSGTSEAGNATRETPSAGGVSAGAALLRDLPERVREAASRIRPYLKETPFEIARGLTHQRAAATPGAAVRWKLECFGVTGSFKIRGALNKLLVLRDTTGAGVLEEGLITASTGNHGRATAHALSLLDGRGVVYLPRTVADSKRRVLEDQYGDVVELRLVGEDAVESEYAAREDAERSGRPFVSPYNDPDIIAGQGTVGFEMDAALAEERLDAVLVPVGGGGLIAGIAGWLKHAHPGIQVVGCQPRASAVMAASVRAGRLLESGRDVPFEPTLADAVAGGVEEGAVTFALCSELVDAWILLDEGDIAAAMRRVLGERFAMVEGSAALPVAALPQLGPGIASVGLVVSGAGISREGVRVLAGD